MVGLPVRCAKRIAYTATILIAEISGLRLAVDYIVKTKSMQSVLCTDSLSSLRALSPLKTSKNPLKKELQNKIIDASGKNIEIFLCWFSSHVGIPGNEESRPCSKIWWWARSEPAWHSIQRLPHACEALYQKEVEQQCNEEVNNKLHLVKPLLSEWKSAQHLERFYEVVFCRLRIGHMQLTYGHLLRREEAPEYENCNGPLTFLHILLNTQRMTGNGGNVFSDLLEAYAFTHFYSSWQRATCNTQFCFWRFESYRSFTTTLLIHSISCPYYLQVTYIILIHKRY